MSTLDVALLSTRLIVADINMRILPSDSKAPNRGDSRKHGLHDPLFYVDL